MDPEGKIESTEHMNVGPFFCLFPEICFEANTLYDALWGRSTRRQAGVRVATIHTCACLFWQCHPMGEGFGLCSLRVEGASLYIWDTDVTSFFPSSEMTYNADNL